MFNDGAFEHITSRDKRAEMLVQLQHGEPMRFGAEREYGVRLNDYGEAEVVTVADVGEGALLVHDETRHDPTVAFALSRLAEAPTSPTPIGVFRAISRPTYEAEVQSQLGAAQATRGPGDLRALIESGSVWDVA